MSTPRSWPWHWHEVFGKTWRGHGHGHEKSWTWTWTRCETGVHRTLLVPYSVKILLYLYTNPEGLTSVTNITIRQNVMLVTDICFTSQTFHQGNWSPTAVTNIDITTKIRSFVIIIKDRFQDLVNRIMMVILTWKKHHKFTKNNHFEFILMLGLSLRARFQGQIFRINIAHLSKSSVLISNIWLFSWYNLPFAR